MHPLRQHKGALEVACGYAAMDVLPAFVVLLAAANDELVFLNSHIELVAGKTSHRQRDTQALGLTVGPVEPLDVVGRIAIGALHDAIVATIEGPGFRGCPFLNAAAEFPEPGHPVRRAVERHREWYVDVLEQVLRELGHPMPGEAADDLMLARDGAMTGGYAGDPIASTTALGRAFDRVIAEARKPVHA